MLIFVRTVVLIYDPTLTIIFGEFHTILSITALFMAYFQLRAMRSRRYEDETERS